VVANDEREQTLNPALLRPGRFDRQVTIPLPTLMERAAILAVHC
jgi:cell division protease FtsH